MKRSNIEKCRKLRKSQTDAERKLWSILRDRQLAGAKFRRQYPIGSYILDFYSPGHKLCIEADGGQHYHTRGIRQDKVRTNVLSKFGIRTIRFSDVDILKNIEGVYEVIRKNLERNITPSP